MKQEPKYQFTIKELQAIIHFFSDKTILANKIKGYINVSKSKLTGQK